MQLEIPLPELQFNTRTQISGTIYSGTTSIPIYDSSGFSNSAFILVGTPTTNSAEVRYVSSVPNTTSITTDATTLTHTVGDSIINLIYDKYQLYKSITGTAGPFTILTTLNIQYNQRTTNYFDPAWSITSAYYYQPLNSITGIPGAPSAILPGTGYAYSSRYNIRNQVRRILKDLQIRQFTDEELNDYIDDIYSEMQQVFIRLDSLYNISVTSFQSWSNSIQEYTLPSDFREVNYVTTSPDGQNFYSAIALTRDQVYNTQFITNAYLFNPYNNAYPAYNISYYIAGNKIGFYPIPQGAGGYKIYYCPLSIQFTDDATSMVSPLSDYRYVIVNGVISLALRKGGNADSERMQEYYGLYQGQLEKMLGDLRERNTQSRHQMSGSDTGWAEPGMYDFTHGTY